MFSLGLTMERVKFAGGDVTLHLLIPRIILDGVQQSLQLATLLQRELVDRRLDFSHRAQGTKPWAPVRFTSMAQTVAVQFGV
jgi:hypothetical protein